MRTNEIKNEIDEIKKWQEKIKQKDVKHETKKRIYDFQQYETKKIFWAFILVKLIYLKM